MAETCAADMPGPWVTGCGGKTLRAGTLGSILFVVALFVVCLVLPKYPCGSIPFFVVMIILLVVALGLRTDIGIFFCTGGAGSPYIISPGNDSIKPAVALILYLPQIIHNP
jgi:hypothetical protein